MKPSFDFLIIGGMFILLSFLTYFCANIFNISAENKLLLEAGLCIIGLLFLSRAFYVHNNELDEGDIILDSSFVGKEKTSSLEKSQDEIIIEIKRLLSKDKLKEAIKLLQQLDCLDEDFFIISSGTYYRINKSKIKNEEYNLERNKLTTSILSAIEDNYENKI